MYKYTLKFEHSLILAYIPSEYKIGKQNVVVDKNSESDDFLFCHHFFQIWHNLSLERIHATTYMYIGSLHFTEA